MTGPLGAIGRCRHGRDLCSECIVVDDAAQRAYDVVRQIATDLSYDERIGYPWVALRLSDGGTDGKSYETRREAIRHQVHEQQCAYFSFRGAPTGFSSPMDAAIYLAYHRRAYASGMRLPDPDARDGGPELIMPLTKEHIGNQLHRLGSR